MNDEQVITFDAFRDRWTMLFDFYFGGDRVRNPTSTRLGTTRLSWQSITEDGRRVGQTRTRSSYLVAHPGESDTDFDARHELSANPNVTAPIIKAYAEGTTANVRRELGPLAAYSEDVDRRGSTWGEFAEGSAKWAALYGMVFTVVDAPKASGVVTKADERAADARPYCIEVHPAAVSWIKYNDAGRLIEFAWTDRPYRVDGSADAKNSQALSVRIRVLTAAHTNEAGDAVPASWSLREGTVQASSSLSAQTENLREVDGGPLPAALGGELPVVPLYFERDTSQPYPAGNSIVADAVDVSRLIYNTLSWASEVLRKTGFPFLALPMGSTGGQLDAGTAVAIGPGKGLGYDATTGAPQWVQPSSESTKELREHCSYLFQWALRTAGLELAADQSSQVQSGEALRIRSRDFESRAKRFANSLQRWETGVLRLLALYAGANPDEVSVTYPKRFTLPDLKEDLERALTLLSAPIEIGAKFKGAAVKQAVDAALSLSDEEITEGMADVEAAFAGDVEEFNTERETKLATLADKLARLKSKRTETDVADDDRAAEGRPAPPQPPAE